MARDRLRWMLRRIALGLPVTPLLLVGCPSTQGLEPDAASVDAFVADAVAIDAPPDLEVGGGPSCMPCGPVEMALTHRHILERGLDPDECMAACLSLVSGPMPPTPTCGGGFPGTGWSQVLGCSVLERIDADAGELTLDAGPDDAGADDAGVDPLGGLVARLSCDVQFCRPAGRRPAALRLARRTSGSVGRWLAEVATLEATSVPAFAELRRELLAHRAPSALVAGTVRAEADEVLHARLVARLAQRAGATPARARVSPTEPRSLADLVVHNAAEGCVRESYGALSALVQSRAARDPDTRRVFARIARDEARHALLSLALDTWARPRVRASDRRRADEAASLAADELHATFPSDTREMRDTLGLPDEARGRELIALCA